MTKEILLSSPAQKQYGALPKDYKTKVRNSLFDLASGQTRNLDTKKLKGVDNREPLFRLRIGKYRVIYKLEKRAIKVIRIMLRKEGYDWL